MGRFGYRLNSTIVTFLPLRILHSAGGFYQFYGERPFEKRYEPRLGFLGVPGDRVEDISISYLPGVPIPAADPKRARIASKKSAPFKRTKPVRSTGVTVILDSSIADEGLGEGLGASSIDETDDDAPGPTCRMGVLMNN